MAIQTFTAAQVLTAAQMNALQANDYNQTVSAKVASYTLVAADKGTRITMSNASATTITVNTSLFAAGDSLRIQNIGAGVCTITAGTATVTSAGPLALVQWAGGQLFFTSASAAVWFPDAVTATASGLTLVSSTTIPAAVTQYTINSVFSATYQNYRVYINNGLGTGSGLLNFYYVDSGGTATTTGMYWQRFFMGWAATSVNTSGGSNVAFSTITNNAANCVLDVMNPNGTGNKSLHSNHPDDGQFWINQGFTANSTQYTGFKITTSAASFGSATNVRIYGLAN
jgi:hypothetical protein